MSIESGTNQPLPFIQELNPPNPELVQKYIWGLPKEKRVDSYNELVQCLVPEELQLFKQRDVNDPQNQELMSYALQRKQNLHAIINNKNIPDNLTTMFGRLPSESLSKSGENDLMSLLSPLEQKVLKGTRIENEGDEGLDNFLIKESLLSVAYNRQKQKEYEAFQDKDHPTHTPPFIEEGTPEVLKIEDVAPEIITEKIPEKTQPLKYIQELDPTLDPALVKKYIAKFPEEMRLKVYNDLLGYLLPEERHTYDVDANDPTSINLLSLAFQRRQNLEAILNKGNIPANYTNMFVQMPPEIMAQPNNEEFISLLSPNEKLKLDILSKKVEENELEDASLERFLARQSILAIAYNRSLLLPVESPPQESFVQELNPPDSNLVREYFGNSPKENREKVYNELLQYLTPEENRIYHVNVDDPSSRDLLSLALQRKQNLEIILSSTDIPENLTAIYKQLPVEVTFGPNNEELLSYLTPAERQQFESVIKKNIEGETLERILAKRSLLAIAYNRQRQKEYQDSIANTQPIRIT